jgi:hypothetical protein
VLSNLRSTSSRILNESVRPLTLAIMVGANYLFQNLYWILFTSVSYTFLTIIYNVTLHPLAKYPGPLLWRISPLPSIGSLLRGRIPFDYRVLHDKYGPVVRVMPNELSFNTTRARENTHGHCSQINMMDKDPIHAGASEAVHGVHVPNIAQALGANHMRQRRALAPAFSPATIREQEAILQSSVSLFVQKLKKMAHDGRPVDVATWFIFCTLDIIGNLSLGEPFGCLQGGKILHQQDQQLLTMMPRRRIRCGRLGYSDPRNHQVWRH